MGAKERGSDGEQGAALVTVLVMLAIMSTLAVLIVDASGTALRRTRNQQEMDQIRWYVAGAEAMALTRVAELTRASADAQVDQDEWQGQSFVFPLDDGLMRVTLWDGDNCFNLNGLVAGQESGVLVGNARTQIQFARLLDELGVRAQSDAGLAAALVDWLDTDQQPSLGGAEIESYGGGEGPYAVANTLMGDASELRSVRGFTPEIISRLAPLTCVRPVSASNRLNPNTLRPDNAELLSIVFGDALPVSRARELIRSRPRGGWSDLNAFFAHPLLAGLEISDNLRDEFSLRTNAYVMMTEVQHRDTVEYAAALIDASGQPRILRRVFGVQGVGRRL